MSVDRQDLESHAARALQDILAGRQPFPNNLQHLTGDVRICLAAIYKAQREQGVEAARGVFATLVNENRPWLKRLADEQRSHVQGERRVRFLDDEAFENQPEREWLIPAILPKEGIALVFGPSGCGKSFLTMAWSLCIATGTPWLGRDVPRGPVAYIAAEGGFGLGPRIKAWKTFHTQSGNSGVKWFSETLGLQDAGNFKELQAAFAEDFARVPVLVVIDTLSRCSAGVDENSNTEMARLIAAADNIQQTYHCTVLIVHHTGKEGDRGPRGASALIGNTETIIQIAQTDEGCRLTCYKQKDAPKFDAFSLKFQTVQYGQTAEESSAVLVQDTAESMPSLRQSEQAMLAALTRAGKALSYSEWKEVGIEVGLKERTVERAIQGLVRDAHVQKSGKSYSVDKTEPVKEVESEEEPEYFYSDPEPDYAYADPESDLPYYDEPADYDEAPGYPEYEEEESEERHFPFG